MNKRLAAGAALTMILALGAAPDRALAAPEPAPAREDAAARCAALADLRLADTSISEATFVPAQAASPVSVGAGEGHRAFCRVVAHVQAEPDSNVGIELWLPADGWTGVFHGNGSGGFGGTFGYSGMADGLRRGFATATTDTGTSPATPLEGEALIGHPRRWRDWARLSTHVMTVTGKAITRAFYRRDANRSLYTGCSTGGQEGLIEALYYPRDYDGILVGAPVINRTWGHAAVLWDYAAAHRTPGSALSEAKLRLLNRTAIATCWRQGHALAGDPFITDPMACSFDPGVLQCTGAASDSCLTTAEVTTARAFYSGPTRADGTPAYYGWLPGSEVPGLFGWSFLQQPINGEPPFAGLFKWVFGPTWTWRNFDFARDMAVVNDRLGPIVNDATAGSLRDFFARGGKLIMFHGLADTLVAPAQSVDFFKRQAGELGGEAMSRSARLYLAPGMMHCGGGTGPDSFNTTLGIPPRPPADDARHDLFSALIGWTSGAAAPDAVIATKFGASEPTGIEMQRPLCPYPAQARYRGVGSTAAPGNFICSVEAGRQPRSSGG